MRTLDVALGCLVLLMCGGCGPELEGDSLDALEAQLSTNGWTAIPIGSLSAKANDGNVPTNVLDNNLATRWSCDGVGCWITADLQSPKQVCGVAIAWYQGATRSNRFEISTGLTDSSFGPATSGQSSATNELQAVALPPSSARYVRVTVNGNSINAWASITELRVYACATPVPQPGAFSALAPAFDGQSGYVEIPDHADYSAATRGAITVEAWMRPDSLNMSRRESSGYVHWLGKGGEGQHEWTCRMYQQGNSEGRGNRISFYAFNLPGKLGAGSYFEDTVTTGAWIHSVGVIDSTRTLIFKNGVQRDTDLLSGYSITPRNGTAPVRIGTRDFNSFFQGSVARVAIYAGKLPADRIKAHYDARFTGAYDSAVLAEPSLVGFWKLSEASGAVAVDAKNGRNGAYRGGVSLGKAAWK